MTSQVDLIELATMAIKARDTYKQENMTLRAKISELETDYDKLNNDMDELSEENYKLMSEVESFKEKSLELDKIAKQNDVLSSQLKESETMNNVLQKLIVNKFGLSVPTPKPKKAQRAKPSKKR